MPFQVMFQLTVFSSFLISSADWCLASCFSCFMPSWRRDLTLCLLCSPVVLTSLAILSRDSLVGLFTYRIKYSAHVVLICIWLTWGWAHESPCCLWLGSSLIQLHGYSCLQLTCTRVEFDLITQMPHYSRQRTYISVMNSDQESLRVSDSDLSEIL